MSERMIELQRARLLAATTGQTLPPTLPPTIGPAASSSSSTGGPHNGVPASSATSMALAPSSQAQHQLLSSPLSGGRGTSQSRPTPHHQSPAFGRGGSSGGIPPPSGASAGAMALHAAQWEDTRVKRFLRRLTVAGGPHSTSSVTSPWSLAASSSAAATAAAASQSTVPPALSRRLLHRQGVAHVDPAISHLVSGATDRFLATILQQAAACRDQRLQGRRAARDAVQRRKRHREDWARDVQDRQRHRDRQWERREAALQATIRAGTTDPSGAAGSGARNPSSSPAASGGAKAGSKAKKKKPTPTGATGTAATATVSGHPNGGAHHVPDATDADGSDDGMYDSLDEEEEYYREYYCGRGQTDDNDEEAEEDDDDDDDDDMLILRDLARPLEAWDFDVTGKEGMDPYFRGEDSDRDDADDDVSDDDSDDDPDGAGAAAHPHSPSHEFDNDNDDEDGSDDVDESTLPMVGGKGGGGAAAATAAAAGGGGDVLTALESPGAVTALKSPP